MDITAYRITDEEFWTRPSRGADPLVGALLGKANGLLVDAPRRIPIDQRSTFPIGAYHIGTIREVHSVPFHRRGTIVAMDVSKNLLHAADARSFEPDRVRKARPGLSDSRTYPDGDGCQTSSLELRETMHVPWRPSSYLVMAILRDQVSNRAAVELCKSDDCYVDAEVAKYEAAELARMNPESVDPPAGAPLPNYAMRPDSPAVPAQPGIVLSAPRIVDARLAHPWLVQGSYRLTPIASEWVKPDWADPHYQGVPRHERPTAVLTLYLLVAGADTGTSRVFVVRAPSWSPPGGDATGYFAVDLRSFTGAPIIAETHFLYAFSGAHMTGPIPTALVGPP